METNTEALSAVDEESQDASHVPMPEQTTQGNEITAELARIRTGTSFRVQQIPQLFNTIEKYLQLEGEQQTIDSRLDELEGQVGISRTFSALEKRSLSQKRRDLLRRINDLKLERQEDIKEIEPLLKGSPRERSIREMCGFVVSRSTWSIRTEYEDFLEKVLGEGQILHEARELYIKHTIAPLVEQQVKDGSWSGDQQKEFYSTLQDYMQYKMQYKDNGRFQDRDRYESAERKLLYELKLGQDLEKACAHLRRDGDKEIVRRLIATLAVPDLQMLKNTIEESAPDDRLKKLLLIDFLTSVNPAFRESSSEHSHVEWTSKIGEQMLVELGLADWQYPDMNFWEALKSSPTANAVFSEAIQKADAQYCHMALDKAISDGGNEHVDILYFYPQPEAIRNLVLLAAADIDRQHPTARANEVLYRLARKGDWRNVLEMAEKDFPALKQAHGVLWQWDYKGWGNHPKIQEAAKALALSILQSPQPDERLTGLASESLPTRSLLDILATRGFPLNKDVEGILEAEAFLERDTRELWPRQIWGGFFIRTVRENLYALVKSKPEEMNMNVERLELTLRLAMLAKKIVENQTNYQMLGYLASEDVVKAMIGTKIQPEFVFLIPEQARALMNKNMRETRLFIFRYGHQMIKDVSDLRFLNVLIGEFGQKADFIIRGYHECITAGTVNTGEKEIVLEFARQFRVVSPTTLGGYKEAKLAGHERAYIAQLKVLAERMTGSGAITQGERKKPSYNDLLRHVYSNNSGHWSSYESNDSCTDRSVDLADFKIKSRYEIDLLSQSEIRVKAGESLNPSVQDEVQQSILGVAERMNALGHNKERIGSSLQTDIDKALKEIVQKGGLQEIDFSSVISTDEKIFLVLADSIYGSRSINPKRVKDLVIAYEFATFEDISDYMAGTRDRVGRANNQDYALLCEVGAFYSDRIKEINRRLVKAAWNNPQIAALMPEYFKQLSQDSATAQRQGWINRLQIDRLGTSESFVKQVARVLEKRSGRKYEPDEVREIIRRYETLTGGLQEKTSTSRDDQTRAFYGQLRSQRERTFEALRVIAGEEVNPEKIHLGEINLQQALEIETRIREGRYNDEQFATYTIQRLIDLFEDERTKIEGELAKFESLSGKQREILYGYITKSKESAHARMVGGICVAGDNPDKDPKQNMWDMPNYFQLVFQEPDTLHCQGLVLMHYFVEEGKKVLTASLNPSCTYLYSVDEEALFTGIMSTLEQFAADNGFDKVVLPKNKTIRTNRTGGEFERAIGRRVTQVGKTFRFAMPKQFSYNPSYVIQDTDVVWEKSRM